jgi:hypothetical protein
MAEIESLAAQATVDKERAERELVEARARAKFCRIVPDEARDKDAEKLRSILRIP